MTAPSDQQEGSTGATTSTTVSVPMANPVATGAGLLVVILNGGTGLITTGITGGSGATWTKRESQVSPGAAGVELWDSLSQAGGAAPTVVLTYPSQARFQAIVLTVPHLSAFDKAVGNSGTSTGPSSGSLTPTAAGEFLIACEGNTASALTAGPTNGFSAATAVGASLAAAYLQDAAGTAISTGWTIAASHSWAGLMGAYTVSGAAAGSALLDLLAMA